MRTSPLLLFVAALAMAAPQLAHAQGGAVVSGTVSAVSGNGATSPAFSGSVGYRFNRALALGVELTQITSLQSPPFDGVIILAGDDDDDVSGRATLFTTNVRVEIPTTMGRVLPFVVGGGGVASVTEAFPVIYYLAANRLGAEVAALIRPTIYPPPRSIESTTLAMALTFGGGASFLITDHVSVDVDLRAVRLLNDNSRTLGRFGVGASYRF